MRKHLLSPRRDRVDDPVALRGQAARRAITLDDHSRITGVGDPQRSPDGVWVAYTVTTIDADKDRRNTDIWMVKWDGSEQLQLTSSPDSESSPRWSPDNKYLAFVASRGTDDEKKKGGQIWLLNRAGGEAQQVSDFKGGVSDIQWSPDSTRIAFVGRRSGSRGRAREDGRLEAQDRAADRDRSLSLQAGSQRLSRSTSTATSASSISRRKTATVITKGNTDDAQPVVVA